MFTSNFILYTKQDLIIPSSFLGAAQSNIRAALEINFFRGTLFESNELYDGVENRLAGYANAN